MTAPSGRVTVRATRVAQQDREGQTHGRGEEDTYAEGLEERQTVGARAKHHGLRTTRRAEEWAHRGSVEGSAELDLVEHGNRREAGEVVGRY